MMEIKPEDSQNNSINQEILAQMKNLMGKKFGLMIENYLEDSAQYIAQAAKALANGNAQLLADLTHPLKSSSASLGIMRVSELAANLEHKADAISMAGEGDLSDLSPMLEELRSSFVEAEGFLKKELAVDDLLE